VVEVDKLQLWRLERTPLEVDLSSFSVFVVENFVDLPQYDLIDIGTSDQVLGMGKFANLVEGRFSNGIPLALKFFLTASVGCLLSIFAKASGVQEAGDFARALHSCVVCCGPYTILQCCIPGVVRCIILDKHNAGAYPKLHIKLLNEGK